MATRSQLKHAIRASCKILRQRGMVWVEPCDSPDGRVPGHWRQADEDEAGTDAKP